MDTDRFFPVLVAIRPDLKTSMQEWLHPDLRPTFAHTLRDARAYLERQRFSLVFCSLHFDHNRLLDLLRHVRSLRGPARVPFIAAALTEGTYTADSVAAVLKSLKVLGANECVDFPQWLRWRGQEEARNELNRTCRRLATGMPA